jgi:curved DNA-binding protein CbpA
MNESYYDILEVRFDASPEIIRAAVRVKLTEHHPDHGGEPEVYKLFIEARDILLDAGLRAAYDETVGANRKSQRMHRSHTTTQPDQIPQGIAVDGKGKRNCAHCKSEISLFAEKCPKCLSSQAESEHQAPTAKCGCCDSLSLQVGDDNLCLNCGCPVLRLDGFYTTDLGEPHLTEETVIRFLSNNKLYIAWGSLKYQASNGVHSGEYGAETYHEDHIRYLLSLSHASRHSPYTSCWRHLDFKHSGPFIEFEYVSHTDRIPDSMRRVRGQIRSQYIDFTLEYWSDQNRWKVLWKRAFAFRTARFES